MTKIVVVGSLNIDMVVRTSRLPAPGETVAGFDLHMLPGGKGANQAVASARQGANVAMVGRVGDDPFGRRLIESLNQEGVGIEHVTLDPEASTGAALIALDARGENSIIVVAGANGNLSPRDVEIARPTLAMADALVVQLEIPLETVTCAVEIAEAQGITVILNAAPAKPLSPELLGKLDYLIVNETEAALLAELDVSQSREAAQRLHTLGARNVVLTLGEQGALLIEVGKSTHAPGFSVQVVDTTGAGDAFVGAFARGIGGGMPALDAVRWANATGALATMVLGAQAALPTQDQVDQFLEQQSALAGKGVL